MDKTTIANQTIVDDVFTDAQKVFVWDACTCTYTRRYGSVDRLAGENENVGAEFYLYLMAQPVAKVFSRGVPQSKAQLAAFVRTALWRRFKDAAKKADRIEFTLDRPVEDDEGGETTRIELEAADKDADTFMREISIDAPGLPGALLRVARKHFRGPNASLALAAINDEGKNKALAERYGTTVANVARVKSLMLKMLAAEGEENF